jgi:hypothetical protein
MAQGKPPERTGVVKLAHALSHPLRMRLLMEMNSPVRRLSPNEYAHEIGMPVNRTAYHFRVLKSAGCIQLVDEQPRRGATEHYYEPVKRAMAWTREWEKLPAVVKQNLAATAICGLVEAVGRSVDAGLYDARIDSHLSFDAFWADELGFTEASMILDRALKELLEIASNVQARLEADPDAEKFLLAYGLTAFETSPKSPWG